MPQHNSSAPSVLSESTVSSLHGSILSNDSISPHLSYEGESVLHNTSNLSIRQLNEMSFFDRVKATSNEANLSTAFPRGSLDDIRLKKKKRKPPGGKSNCNDSLKTSDSSSSSSSSSSSINISNPDDSFFKKPNVPKPRRKRQRSEVRDSWNQPDKSPVPEQNVELSRKVSVNLNSDLSSESVNESLENSIKEISPESSLKKCVSKYGEVKIPDEKEISSDTSQNISEIDSKLGISSNDLDFTDVDKVAKSLTPPKEKPSRKVSVKLASLLDDSEIEEQNSIASSEKSRTSVVNVSLSESDSFNLENSIFEEAKVNNINGLKSKRISVHFPLDESVSDEHPVSADVKHSSGELEIKETNELIDNLQDLSEGREPELDNKLAEPKQRKSILHRRSSSLQCKTLETNDQKSLGSSGERSRSRKSTVKFNIDSSSTEHKKPTLRRSARKSVIFSNDARDEPLEKQNETAGNLSEMQLALDGKPCVVDTDSDMRKSSNDDIKNPPRIVERLSELDDSISGINISDISGLTHGDISKISAFDCSNSTSLSRFSDVDDDAHKNGKLKDDVDDSEMNEPELHKNSPNSAKGMGRKISRISNLSLLSNETLALSEDQISDEDSAVSDQTFKDNMKSKRLSVHFNLDDTSPEQNIERKEDEKNKSKHQTEKMPSSGLSGKENSSTSIQESKGRGRVSAISNLTLMSNETLALSEDPVSDEDSTVSDQALNNKMKSRRVSVHFNLDDTSPEQNVERKEVENDKSKCQTEKIPSSGLSLVAEEENNPSIIKETKGRGRVSAISNLTLLSNETLALEDNDDDDTSLRETALKDQMKTRRVSVHFNLDDTSPEQNVERKEVENDKSKCQTEKIPSSGLSLVAEEENNPSIIKETKGRGRVSAISNLTLLSNETLALKDNDDDDTSLRETALKDQMKTRRVSVHFNLDNTADESVQQSEKENIKSLPYKIQSAESVNVNPLANSDTGHSESLVEKLKGKVSKISNLTLLSNETLALSEDQVSDEDSGVSDQALNNKMKSRRISVHFNLDDTSPDIEGKEDENDKSKHQTEKMSSSGLSLGAGEGNGFSSIKEAKGRGRVSEISNLTLLSNETLALSEDPVSDEDSAVSDQTLNNKMKSRRVSVHFNLDDTSPDIEGKEDENDKSKHQTEKMSSSGISLGAGEDNGFSSIKEAKGRGRVSEISNLTLLSNETLALSEDPVSDEDSAVSDQTLSNKMKSRRVSVHFNLDDTSPDIEGKEDENDKSKHQTEKMSSSGLSLGAGEDNGFSSIKEAKGRGRVSAISNLTLLSNETLDLDDNDTSFSETTLKDQMKSRRVSVHFNLDDTKKNILEKEFENVEPGIQTEETVNDGVSPDSEACRLSSIKDKKGRVSTISNFTLLSNETLALSKDQVSDEYTTLSDLTLKDKVKARRVSLHIDLDSTASNENLPRRIEEKENNLQSEGTHNAPFQEVFECQDKPVSQKPRKSILRRSTRISSINKLAEDSNLVTNESPKMNSDNAKSKSRKSLRKSVTFSTDTTIKTIFNEEHVKQSNFNEIEEESENHTINALEKERSIVNESNLNGPTVDMSISNLSGLTNTNVNNSLSKEVSMDIENESARPDYAFSTNCLKQKTSSLISSNQRKASVHIPVDDNVIAETKVATKDKKNELCKTYTGENDCMEFTMVRKSIVTDSENNINRTNYKTLPVEEDLSLANICTENNHLDETRRTVAGMDFTVINSDNMPVEICHTVEDMSFATTINQKELQETMEITFSGKGNIPSPPNAINLQTSNKMVETENACGNERERTVSYIQNKQESLVGKQSRRSSSYANKLSKESTEANSGTDSSVNDSLLNAVNVYMNKIKQKEPRCSQVSQIGSNEFTASDKVLDDISISRVSDIELTAHSTNKNEEQTINNSVVSRSGISNVSFDDDIPSSTLIENSKTLIEDKTNLYVKGSKRSEEENVSNRQSNKHTHCNLERNAVQFQKTNPNSNPCELISDTNNRVQIELDNSTDSTVSQERPSNTSGISDKQVKHTLHNEKRNTSLENDLNEENISNKAFAKECEYLSLDNAGNTFNETSINKLIRMKAKQRMSVYFRESDSDDDNNANNSSVSVNTESNLENNCKVGIFETSGKEKNVTEKNDQEKIFEENKKLDKEAEISSMSSLDENSLSAATSDQENTKISGATLNKITTEKNISKLNQSAKNKTNSFERKMTTHESTEKIKDTNVENTIFENSDINSTLDESVMNSKMYNSGIPISRKVSVNLDMSGMPNNSLTSPSCQNETFDISSLSKSNICTQSVFNKKTSASNISSEITKSQNSEENNMKKRNVSVHFAYDSSSSSLSDESSKSTVKRNSIVSIEASEVDKSEIVDKYMQPLDSTLSEMTKNKDKHRVSVHCGLDTNSEVNSESNSLVYGSKANDLEHGAVAEENEDLKSAADEMSVNLLREDTPKKQIDHKGLEESKLIRKHSSNKDNSLETNKLLDSEVMDDERTVTRSKTLFSGCEKVSIRGNKKILNDSVVIREKSVVREHDFDDSQTYTKENHNPDATFIVQNYESHPPGSLEPSQSSPSVSTLKSLTEKLTDCEMNQCTDKKTEETVEYKQIGSNNEINTKNVSMCDPAINNVRSALIEPIISDLTKQYDQESDGDAITPKKPSENKRKTEEIVDSKMCMDSIQDKSQVNRKVSGSVVIGDLSSFVNDSVEHLTHRKDRKLNRHVSVFLEDTSIQPTFASSNLVSANTFRETLSKEKESLCNEEENGFKKVEGSTSVTSSSEIFDKNNGNNKKVSVGITFDNTSVKSSLSDITKFDDQKASDNDSASFVKLLENKMAGSNLGKDSGNDLNLRPSENVNRHVSVALEDTSIEPTIAESKITSANSPKEILREESNSLNIEENTADCSNIEKMYMNAKSNQHVSVRITFDNTSIQPTISDITEFNTQKTSDDLSVLFKKSSDNELPESNFMADSSGDLKLRKKRNTNRHVSVVLEDTSIQQTIADSNMTSASILKEAFSEKGSNENKSKGIEESTRTCSNYEALEANAGNNRQVSVGITFDNSSVQPTISDITEFDTQKTLGGVSTSPKKSSDNKVPETNFVANSDEDHTVAKGLTKDIRKSRHLSVNLDYDESSLMPNITGVTTQISESITPSQCQKPSLLSDKKKLHVSVDVGLNVTSKKNSFYKQSQINNGNLITSNIDSENTEISDPTQENFDIPDNTNQTSANDDILENIEDSSKDLSHFQNIDRRPSTILKNDAIDSIPLMPPLLISDVSNSDSLPKEIDPIESVTSNCVSLITNDQECRVDQDSKITSFQDENKSVDIVTDENCSASINVVKKDVTIENVTRRLTRNSLKKITASDSSIANQSSSSLNQTKKCRSSLNLSEKNNLQHLSIPDIEELNLPNLNQTYNLPETNVPPLKSNSPCVNSPNAEKISLTNVSPTCNLELNVTLDGFARISLPESPPPDEPKEKVIDSKKTSRSTSNSSKSNETKGEKPYNLRKSSPNLSQTVNSKRKRKSVTFGQNTYKNASSGESSSTNTKPPASPETRKSKSNDSERGLQVSSGAEEHVFIRPDLPVRKSVSMSMTKRSRSNLEENTSNEESNCTSKRKKKSDKTINELSYDTSLDMSEIPRDERLLHKKLIYHSTPINPVLEKRKKNKSNKNNERSEGKDGYSDKIIQVSKGFASSSDTAISKHRAQGSSACYSQEQGSSESSHRNQTHVKRKETSPNKQFLKRKKNNAEYENNTATSSGSRGYSSEDKNSIPDSPPQPRYQVQFKQNVHFKGISSESSRTDRNQSSFLLSEISGRSYFSDSFYSSFSSSRSNNSSLPWDEISKRVNLRMNISHPSISSISVDMSKASNHLEKQNRFSKISQKLDLSKLTSTGIEEGQSERQGTQNVSAAPSELPTIASECLSMKKVFGNTILPTQIKRAKSKNIEPFIMPIQKKVSQKYDFKNDPRFNVDNKPFSQPKIKFPATWVHIELFKYLKGKLQISLNGEAANMAERIISHLCAAEVAIQRLNNDDDIELATLVLRKLLVKYNICPTQLEYSLFLINFTPFSFHRKVTKIIIKRNPEVSNSIVHESETVDINF